jgi:transposase
LEEAKVSPDQDPIPDWNVGHQELQRKDVTLALLWDEYKQAHPNGYQYSWFCREYRTWRGKLDLVMRQTHRAGEKLFVDYTGQTVSVITPDTGEVHQAEIFVAVLGASNYTYACDICS